MKRHSSTRILSSLVRSFVCRFPIFALASFLFFLPFELAAFSFSKRKPSKASKVIANRFESSSAKQASNSPNTWQELESYILEYQSSDPTVALQIIKSYLGSYPKSPLLDKARLLGAKLAMGLSQDLFAYELCSQIKEPQLQLAAFELRLHLLLKMERYSDVERVFKEDQPEGLKDISLATCEFYVAKAIVKSLGIDAINTLDPRHISTPLSTKAFEQLQEAIVYYERCVEYIGFDAWQDLGDCYSLLGENPKLDATTRKKMQERAVKNYLEASESPGAGIEKDRALLLAASVLKQYNFEEALAISKRAYQIKGSYQSLAAWIFIQTTYQKKDYASFLENMEIVESAAQYRGVETYWMLSDIYKELGRNVEEQKTLEKLLLSAFEDKFVAASQKTMEALFRLADFLKNENNPDALESWTERYGKKLGRDESYFNIQYLIGSLYEEKNELDKALKAYSRIAIQNPTFSQIGECLLRKGLLEKSLGKEIQAWGTLGLYLKEHASHEGELQAWPPYLDLTLTLNDYDPAKSLHEARLLTVFKILSDSKADLTLRQEWLAQAVSKIENTNESAKGAQFLSKLSAVYPLLMSPLLEFKKVTCQVQSQNDFESYFKEADAIFAKAKAGPKKSRIELEYIDTLDRLKKSFPTEGARFDQESLKVLERLFESSPKALSKERLMALFEFTKAKLNLTARDTVWNHYFPDNIYCPEATVFAVPKLSNEGKLALERLVRIGDKIKDKDENPSFELSLHMGYLSYLAGNMDVAASWVPKEAMQEPLKECERLALLAAITQGTKDMETYWDAASGVLEYLKSSSAPSHVIYNFELSMARSAEANAKELASEIAATSNRISSLKTKLPSTVAASDWQKRAIALFDEVDQSREAVTEPYHLEAAIEASCLKAWSVKDFDKAKFQASLLATKLRYSEESEGFETYLQAIRQEKELLKLYQAYLVLIDALLTENEAEMGAFGNLGDSADERRAKLNIARDLYLSLHKHQYIVNEFLAKQVDRGVKRVEKLQKGNIKPSKP